MVSRCNQTHPPNTGDVGGALDAQRLAFGTGSFERLDLNSEAFGADATRAIQDLATSFPALLFALTTGYGTPERRASVPCRNRRRRPPQGGGAGSRAAVLAAAPARCRPHRPAARLA